MCRGAGIAVAQDNRVTTDLIDCFNAPAVPGAHDALVRQCIGDEQGKPKPDHDDLASMMSDDMSPEALSVSDRALDRRLFMRLYQIAK